MNLAEYPIALLADRAPAGIKTVVYHDKDETVTITGSDLLGLPTALDVDVIIGLLHLTKKKNNYESTTLHFTRYELMKVLGWPDRGFYYERLTESLNRWVGVTLIYKKSWWDNDTKTKGNYSFHILEAATVIEQEQRRGCRTRQIAPPPSTIRWSSEFFKSFQANNLKKLDLKVYFSLKSSISKQLYRFLDKRFYKKSEWTFDLRTLACEHVGMSRNYECWRLKQKLQPAIDELTEAGFLKGMDSEERFAQTGRGQWSVTFARSGVPVTAPQALPADGVGDGEEPSELQSELVARGVSSKTARELVTGFPEERVRAQIEQVDWLKKKGTRKILDLGAYLTKAVRDDYSRPEGFVSKAEKAEQQRAMNERRKLEAAEARRKREHARRCDEANAQVREYWDGLSAEGRDALDREAVAAADPEFVKVYEQTAVRGGSLAASLFRLSIRNPFIRTTLGLPQDDASE
ncbi:replication initiator protein A [Paludisphaera mucosa]|uniref:Replication initiator protein A n=1 Tax=Paludisphaera mucosa TaxID=3030827 RepID=A0ABT6FLC2_9BACT|nr:replication initiator protein A [Paludisphaera mucosa]MDG3008382.1 replication initiator protein A [Paludisphaera mucosa]